MRSPRPETAVEKFDDEIMAEEWAVFIEPDGRYRAQPMDWNEEEGQYARSGATRDEAIYNARAAMAADTAVVEFLGL